MTKETADQTTVTSPFDAFASLFKMPEIEGDFGLDGMNKSMGAASEAGRILFDGAKAVMAKNIDIARENVQEVVDLATGAVTNKTPEASFQTVSDLTAKMAQRNMAGMREVADLMIDANQKAVTVMQERYAGALDEMSKGTS